MPLNNESIGALWEAKSQRGDTFFTGNITIKGSCGKDHFRKILMFPNRYRTEENRQPKFRILLAEERSVQIEDTSSPTPQNPEPKYENEGSSATDAVAEDQGEIPF